MAGGVAHPNHPIVVFDGVCNLCNRWVDFLIRHDRNGRFRVTPNQGETALSLLGPDAAATDTIVLFDERGRHDRSTAVLRIAGGLPWPWKAAAAGLIVPPPVRNGLYKLVARNRFRWWGRRESCRLPTPDEQERFLP